MKRVIEIGLGSIVIVLSTLFVFWGTIFSEALHPLRFGYYPMIIWVILVALGIFTILGKWGSGVLKGMGLIFIISLSIGGALLLIIYGIIPLMFGLS